jgi:hypothetical protein
MNICAYPIWRVLLIAYDAWDYPNAVGSKVGGSGQAGFGEKVAQSGRPFGFTTVRL